ncbi:hypothetical protein [Halocynthiibacter namhaensis]|uniref:hypothetical protein n=1 Tax=Halocynthiibacter namhaensis TaxID=1290553 RepID=UPI0005792E94|nr:hypothetical protein [Halocynthiibacter namhaensis]
MSELKEIIKIEAQHQKDGSAPKGKLNLLNEAAPYTMEQDIDPEATIPVYDLNDDQRDRLLAHARQDASLAVYVSHEAMKTAKALRHLIWFLLLICLIILWRIW